MSLALKKKWRESILFDAANLLDKGDQRKIVLAILLQISLGFLDLVGVLMIGVIGALAITGLSSGQPGDRVSIFLNLVGLEDASLQTQVATIGLVAALILVGRTIFSMYFARKVQFFLSRRGAVVSARLVRTLLRQSLPTLQEQSLQTRLYAVTQGVSLLTAGVLGVFVSLISDLSLLIVLLTGLFVVDNAMATVTFIIFLCLTFIMWKFTHLKMKSLGTQTAEISVKSSETIVEVLTSYREITVRNRKGFYAQLIGKQRMTLANLNAEMLFIPNVSKYVIEIVIVVFGVLIAGYQFMVNDAGRAIATLSIFLAATTRIAPAFLRVQQGLVSMKGSIAAARPTLELLRELDSEMYDLEILKEPDFKYDGFVPQVKLERVSFKYPNAKKGLFEEISLTIEKGYFVGFVGPSGAGKTTLVDLMLGILDPNSGRITISGLSPKDAIALYPGAIAYVPQDIVVVNGSIKRNITLGFPEDSISDELVWNALKVAHLDDFVEKLPHKLDALVGDRGTKLSGGQRQRLGIARAMITKPKILVLDEATSALDGELETNIGEAIQRMRGEVTIVMIAHRLSTIRNCDAIFHFTEGKLTGHGTFEELKKYVPEFSRQAALMGL